MDKPLAQFVRLRQITPSSLIIDDGYTIEIDMFHAFDAWIAQAPVVNNAGHWGFPIGLIVLFPKKRCADDQGFFVVQQGHAPACMAFPAFKG